ncbi:MAG: hypothetical protein IJH61_02230 [Eubacteriaceae bacterium]|nr:hypothetical protein [Eubacteriaceae bacterium]
MDTYLHKSIIDITAARQRAMALFCVLRAVFLGRDVICTAGAEMPEIGDLSIFSDIPEQRADRTRWFRLRHQFLEFSKLPLQRERRRILHRIRPQSGHDYIPGNQKGKAENVHGVYPSTVLVKYENFINRLKGKETNLKGANHELQG